MHSELPCASGYTYLYVHNYVALDSEVVDSRVCLQSADKEIAEIKAKLEGERHSHQAKIMENMQRVSPKLFCVCSLVGKCSFDPSLHTNVHVLLHILFY